MIECKFNAFIFFWRLLCCIFLFVLLHISTVSYRYFSLTLGFSLVYRTYLYRHDDSICIYGLIATFVQNQDIFHIAFARVCSTFYDAIHYQLIVFTFINTTGVVLFLFIPKRYFLLSNVL